MLILLPLLLVLQNAILGLSAPTEFNLNITVQCKRKLSWCYKINLKEQDLISDDELAKTDKKCIDSEPYANHIMHSWIEDDGWFNDFAEVYVEIIHNCNRYDKIRRIEHYLGQKELIEDNKIDADSYTDIFTAMANSGLMPDTVYSDFSTATSTAAERVWPDSKILYSYRHWKTTIRNQMKRSLKNDDERGPFRRFLQGLYSLAFADPEKIVEFYQYICKIAIALDSRLMELMDFMNRMYIGDECEPMFKNETWSCLERCRDELEDFANNPSEDLMADYRGYFNGGATSQKIQQTLQATMYWTDGILQRMADACEKPVKNTPEALESAKSRSADFRRRVVDSYDSPTKLLSVLAPVIPLTR